MIRSFNSSWSVAGLVLSLFIFKQSPALAKTETFLDLSNFLSQVTKNNQSYQSSMMAAAGAEERSKEGESLFMPTLFANTLYSFDQSPKPSPAFQGTKTVFSTYSLGISKNFDFGLNSKIYYMANYTSITGVAPGLVNLSSYYDTKPAIELTYSLWRNRGSSETKAQAESMEAQALATHHTESYRAKVTLAQAEVAYWRLALARDVIRVQRENLDRARKIREWNARRVRLRLADDSDLLQADALLKLREIEVQAALDEERTATQSLNLARGIDSDQVTESIQSLASLVATQAPLPVRKEMREDVLAAKEQERAVNAASNLAIERGVPTVEVYSALSLNGHQAELPNSIRESVQSNPMASVGLRLNVPLDFNLLQDSKRGYLKEIQAAELGFRRRVFEQDVEWEDLVKKYKEAVVRLDLTRKVEGAQKKKFTNEQERHSRGKTTVFLVLQFEQDYATAQVSRLRSEADLMNIVALMKTF